jgi:heme-degrading monooxygenase HmoA
MTIRTDTSKAHLQPAAGLITLINVFTVEPADQEHLLEAWQRATEEVIRHQPGFVSATIHRSLDGTKVVNYAEWQGHDALAAMLRNPEAREQMARLAQIGTPSPLICEIVSVHLGPAAGPG